VGVADDQAGMVADRLVALVADQMVLVTDLLVAGLVIGSQTPQPAGAGPPKFPTPTPL